MEIYALSRCTEFSGSIDKYDVHMTDQECSIRVGVLLTHLMDVNQYSGTRGGSMA